MQETHQIQLQKILSASMQMLLCRGAQVGKRDCVIAHFQDRENVRNIQFGRDFVKFIAGLKRKLQIL